MILKELITNIDSIKVEFDYQKLNKKIKLLNDGLSILQENPHEEFAKEMLRRIIYFGYELDFSKAFELASADFYKPLILKAVPLARVIFKDNQELLPFLKDYLTFETDINTRINIEKEINKIEHGNK